ncbi:hypothetical protein ABPG77_007520 [Micractinium sp. CCAP 211/92]
MRGGMWGACRQVLATQALLLVLIRSAAGFVGPSLSPPGGLDPKDTPQFVIFTHDDAIMQDTYNAMTSVTNGQASLDGCPAVATMFTLVTGTDCELAVKLFDAGYEIADHTITHRSVKGVPAAQLEKETVGARSQIAECGIPEGDIVGFRAPYLETDIALRKELYTNGFLYESSIIEPTNGDSVSQGQGKRVWPFQMDKGVPIDCSYFDTEQCSTSERWPGMWEVPVWWLTKDGTENGTPYSMDYGDNTDAYSLLKANFDAAYSGNRAPLPIFIHTPWLTSGTNLAGVKKFVGYALSKPNTYLVTIRQLLAWMENPVPASQLTPEILGCGNPGGAGGSDVAAAPSPAEGPSPGAAPAPAPQASRRLLKA